MTTETNAVRQEIAPTAFSMMRTFYWSVRRELWEHRSIYIAPLAAAAVFLFGFVISLISLPHRMRDILALDPSKQREAIAMPYDVVAGLIMVITLVVGFFYCLEALYGERRDRGILFWKSMPVSDLTTVLAKASIPILGLQLLAFTITFVTQMIMLLLSSAVLAVNGVSVATLWTRLSLFSISALLLYHLVALHGIWWAPIYSWLLLVSSWARRVPILWAVLPPLAIGVAEKVAFKTTYFGTWLGNRFSGGTDVLGDMSSNFPIEPMAHVHLGRYLTLPGLWGGLIFAAVFLFAAARMRRYRQPI